MVKFWGEFFLSLFNPSPASFGEFDSGNAILFQFEYFGGKVKETALEKYFIKVTAHLSFT